MISNIYKNPKLNIDAFCNIYTSYFINQMLYPGEISFYNKGKTNNRINKQINNFVYLDTSGKSNVTQINTHVYTDIVRCMQGVQM